MSTEFEFELPHGYVDDKGKLHKFGIMRPSTADDEIFIRKHGKYRLDHAFEIIGLLSKVILKLGSLEKITPEIIEKLYEEDLDFLKSFYKKINENS